MDSIGRFNPHVLLPADLAALLQVLDRFQRLAKSLYEVYILCSGFEPARTPRPIDSFNLKTYLACRPSVTLCAFATEGHLYINST